MVSIDLTNAVSVVDPAINLQIRVPVLIPGLSVVVRRQANERT